MEYKNRIEEIVESSTKKALEKKEKKDTNIEHTKVEKTDPIVRSARLRNRDAIQEIRSEIHTLKQDVKEILRLMNALYDFESQ